MDKVASLKRKIAAITLNKLMLMLGLGAGLPIAGMLAHPGMRPKLLQGLKDEFNPEPRSAEGADKYIVESNRAARASLNRSLGLE